MQFFTMVTTSDLWVVVRRERRELKRFILRESADSAEKKAGVTCGQVEMGGQENFNKGHKISLDLHTMQQKCPLNEKF